MMKYDDFFALPDIDGFFFFFFLQFPEDQSNSVPAAHVESRGL